MDTLRIAGGNIDLGSLAGIASGIERIDIATDSAPNNVTLSAADVVNLSDTDVLTLVGTAADSVNAAPAGPTPGSMAAVTMSLPSSPARRWRRWSSTKM